MARRSRATAQFRREVDNRFPMRPRTSDGWIGDAAHRNRVSDHNPNRAGVVQAEDVTLTDHQGDWLWNFLISSRDPRIKYVIYRKRIFSSYATSSRKAWEPGAYTGFNAHLTHLHLSVQDLAALYDDGKPWGIAESVTEEEDEVFAIKYGENSDYVRRAQRVMNAASEKAGMGVNLTLDGQYGPKTRDAVNAFASKGGMPADGGKGMHLLVVDYCRNWLR